MNEPADVAPWIERLARVGYVAKAVLYGTIGTLAAQAAFGEGGRATGGALRELLRAPYGRAMLIVIAVGVLGYAFWLFVRAASRNRSPCWPKSAAGPSPQWGSGW